MNPIQSIYQTQSPMTDPGKYAYLYENLPDGLSQFTQAIHSVLIHHNDSGDRYQPNSIQPREQFLHTMQPRLSRIIDLGQEGGDEGGYLVAEGTPEAVARVPRSDTGLSLRTALEADNV